MLKQLRGCHVWQVKTDVAGESEEEKANPLVKGEGVKVLFSPRNNASQMGLALVENDLTWTKKYLVYQYLPILYLILSFV